MGFAGGCGILVWAKAVAEIPPSFCFFKDGAEKAQGKKGMVGRVVLNAEPSLLRTLQWCKSAPLSLGGTPCWAASPQTSGGGAA